MHAFLKQIDYCVKPESPEVIFLPQEDLCEIHRRVVYREHIALSFSEGESVVTN